MKKSVSIVAGVVFIAGIAAFTVDGIGDGLEKDLQIYDEQATDFKRKIAIENDEQQKEADTEALFATQQLYDYTINELDSKE